MNTVYILQTLWCVTVMCDVWHVTSTLKRTITKSILIWVAVFCALHQWFTPGARATSTLSWGKSLGWSKWPLRCTWFRMWGDLPGWGWWTGWPLTGSRAYWWRLLPQLERCSMWIIWVSVCSDHQVKNGHTCRSRMQYVQRRPLASGEGRNLVGRVSMKPCQVHQLMAPWKCDTLPRVWVTSTFEQQKWIPPGSIHTEQELETPCGPVSAMSHYLMYPTPSHL